MTGVTRLVAWLIALGGLCAPVAAQQLVPLADQVSEPLLPAGISASDVEMFGELVYLWKDNAGTDVIHFIGDFALHSGARRLKAQEAVIWMMPATEGNNRFNRFEIVLWRNARVIEPGGTTTKGPALFVTLKSAGKVQTSADRKSFSAATDSTTFARAARIRRRLRDQSGTRSAAETPLTVVNLGPRASEPQFEVRSPVAYQGREMTVHQIDGKTVVTAIGDVYVFRGEPTGLRSLELRADSAVVFLGAVMSGEDSGDDRPDVPVDDRPGRFSPGSPLESASSDLATGGLGLGTGGNVEAVYLEGDIVLSYGDRTVKATRLYYDFTSDKALILDAAVRFFEPRRNLPIILRASEVRQLSTREFAASDAILTTSEFHTPHAHVGAAEVSLVDETTGAPVVARDAVGGLPTGRFSLRKATFNVEGQPIMHWPKIEGRLRDSESSLRSIRTGYSGNFGAELETRWELFNVLGLERPTGFDGALSLDGFTERGPGIGVNLDYETDYYFGLYRGYFIYDEGEDNLGGQFNGIEPSTKTRGRTTLRHRQYLPDDWQVTFELSYMSDRNFLEEWFEPEFDTGKEQESLVFLKKQVDNWAFTSLLQYRLNDFLTTVERLPDFAFFLVGEDLGGVGTLFSENRAGLVRYRPADQNLIEDLAYGDPGEGSGTVARIDSRQEVELPFSVGDLKIVPFGSIRGTAWDDTPASGGEGRVLGTYGVRASSYAWKVMPNVRSELLDINGVRHIVKGDIVAWGANDNVNSDDLYFFDETVEQVDEIDGFSAGIRQRWQTKRGAPGRQRIVDVLTLDVEVGFFGDAQGQEQTNGFASPTRPENSVTQNYLNTALVYRINDATALASETNYDWDAGTLDIFTLSYAVERSPRFSYLVAYRYLNDTESNLIAAGMNYRINEKYTVAIREAFDLQRGETAEFDIGFIRKFPRWYMGVTFAVDEIEDDFGVSVSIWPEGLPRAALGNRRFTGLATSTGIRPGY